jgi:hypothetical protein
MSLRAAAQQALEALELAYAGADAITVHGKAITAIRAALAAAEPEPVAWMWQHDETGRIGFVEAWQIEHDWQQNNPRCRITGPLYAAPPQREPLTDEQIVCLWEASTGHKMPNMGSSQWQLLAVARAIERAHGISAPKDAG